MEYLFIIYELSIIKKKNLNTNLKEHATKPTYFPENSLAASHDISLTFQSSVPYNIRNIYRDIKQ